MSEKMESAAYGLNRSTFSGYRSFLEKMELYIILMMKPKAWKRCPGQESKPTRFTF